MSVVLTALCDSSHIYHVIAMLFSKIREIYCTLYGVIISAAMLCSTLDFESDWKLEA